MERLAEHYEPLALLDDVLKLLHKDKEVAALLIPKLKQGCKDFMAKKRSGSASLDGKIPGGTLCEDKLRNIVGQM